MACWSPELPGQSFLIPAGAQIFMPGGRGDKKTSRKGGFSPLCFLKVELLVLSKHLKTAEVTDQVG